jgi:hypothetical protein
MGEWKKDEVGVSVEDLIRPIFNEKPGAVQPGNVCFKCDDHQLSWDTPVMDWDMNAIGEDLVRHAIGNQQLTELMKECGYPD